MKLLKEQAAKHKAFDWIKLFQALSLVHTDLTLLRTQTTISNTKSSIYVEGWSLYSSRKKKKRQNISTHVSGYKKGKKKSEAIVGFEGAKISC